MTEVIYDMSIESYHAARHLSAHRLGDFADRGPRYYAMRYLRGSLPPREQTDAMRFGQLFEDCLSGVSTDWSKYAIKPEGMSFATKEGKAWRLANEGKDIISQGELDDLKYMTESVSESELALSMTKRAKAQVSLRDDGACTFGLQSRPDWVSLEENWSLDLKTTQSLGMLTSGKAVRDFRYHCQAALVRRLMGQLGFTPEHYLLGVERIAPYRCQVIRFPQEWIDAGTRWCDAQIAGIESCIEAGEWPRVESQMVDLPPPPSWL